MYTFPCVWRLLVYHVVYKVKLRRRKRNSLSAITTDLLAYMHHGMGRVASGHGHYSITVWTELVVAA